MENDNWMLVCKADKTLFVILTTNEHGRKQWEYTESRIAATKFPTATEADKQQTFHHCPRSLVKPLELL